MKPILLVQHEVDGSMICDVFSSYADAGEVYGTMIKEEWYSLTKASTRSISARMAAGKKDKEDQDNRLEIEAKRREIDRLLHEIENLGG